MFKIYDGREEFYQWDVDRKLIVDDATINQVHFCNRTDDCSLVCEVYNDGSKRVVNVPNILLQNNWRIYVFGFDENYTKFSERFDVVARTRPADYVYTETDVLSYSALLERIEMVEEDVASINEVYVGSDVPTDENVEVWIDPDAQSEFATVEYVNEAIKNVEGADLTNYALKSDIPDLTDYAKKEDIPEAPDLTDYALKSEIPDVSEFVVMSDITALGYQTAEQVQTAITTALGAIANAEDGAY